MHYSKIVSSSSRGRRCKWRHAPFTEFGALAAHNGGVETTELETVLITVDRPPTEQPTREPELFDGGPA
jgi:hypothetical protein